MSAFLLALSILLPPQANDTERLAAKPSGTYDFSAPEGAETMMVSFYKGRIESFSVSETKGERSTDGRVARPARPLAPKGSVGFAGTRDACPYRFDSDLRTFL